MNGLFRVDNFRQQMSIEWLQVSTIAIDGLIYGLTCDLEAYSVFGTKILIFCVMLSIVDMAK